MLRAKRSFSTVKLLAYSLLMAAILAALALAVAAYWSFTASPPEPALIDITLDPKTTLR